MPDVAEQSDNVDLADIAEQVLDVVLSDTAEQVHDDAVLTGTAVVSVDPAEPVHVLAVERRGTDVW